VRLTEPVTPLNVALMFVVPAPTPVAVRREPPPLPTFAMLVSLDVHLAIEVMSCDVASLNKPVAWKPTCPPIGIVLPTGETVIDEIVALVTVKVVDVVTAPRVAVMVVVPVAARACPVAIPFVAMVATVVSDEPQVT
jgi:hypothetical protein